MILLKNCSIINDDEIVSRDILIENDTIVKIESKIEENLDCEIVDLEHKYVLPGFIDFNAQLDDEVNGFKLADSYDSGTRVALKNGITTLFSFITQHKNETLRDAVERVQQKASGNIWCDVGWHLVPTTFDEPSHVIMAELIEEGFVSFKLYTTFRNRGLYSSYSEIEIFAKKYASKQISILVHCEDDALITSNMKRARVDMDNFVKVRSKTVEQTAVSKILRIARKSRAHFHLVNISTNEAMVVVNRMKYQNFVSCEISPQYLFLDNSVYSQPNAEQYICFPPLRDKENNDSLLNGLKNNYFNIITSNHSPFATSNKSSADKFSDKSANGFCGLDFLPYLTANIFSREFDKLKHLQQKLATEPALVAGIYPEKGTLQPGSIADLIVVDFDQEHLLKGREGMFNPYKTVTSSLNIRKVMKAGRFVVEDGELLISSPAGIMI
ncbi:MAG: amidohydrolase family protein [Candidatus Cloacimonadales bacterium]